MEKRTRKPGKSWTHCRGLQEQFVEKILSGEKTTTIRPDAKNMQAGDRIKFFTGWRKKEPIYQVTVDIVEEPIMFELYETFDRNVFRVCLIEPRPNNISCFPCSCHEKRIAIADGFNSFDEMVAFFKANYPKNCKDPHWCFSGALITFANPRIEAL